MFPLYDLCRSLALSLEANLSFNFYYDNDFILSSMFWLYGLAAFRCLALSLKYMSLSTILSFTFSLDLERDLDLDRGLFICDYDGPRIDRMPSLDFEVSVPIYY